MSAPIADDGPELLAEAAFAPNNLPLREAHARDLFPGDPAQQEEFRLAWARLQVRFEREGL